MVVYRYCAILQPVSNFEQLSMKFVKFVCEDWNSYIEKLSALTWQSCERASQTLKLAFHMSYACKGSDNHPPPPHCTHQSTCQSRLACRPKAKADWHAGPHAKEDWCVGTHAKEDWCAGTHANLCPIGPRHGSYGIMEDFNKNQGFVLEGTPPSPKTVQSQGQERFILQLPTCLKNGGFWQTSQLKMVHFIVFDTCYGCSGESRKGSSGFWFLMVDCKMRDIQGVDLKQTPSLKFVTCM
jgi:hypothetical protein